MKKLVRRALKIKGEILVIQKRHGKNPMKNFSYYGGFDLGYLKGQLSILEDVMTEDEFDEFIEGEKLLISSFNNSEVRKMKREEKEKKKYKYWYWEN